MFKVSSDISDAYENGRHHVACINKVWPSTFSTANAWWDATMAGNFPRASYYAGNDYEFTPYPSSEHLSFWHGGNVAPSQKVLRTSFIHASGGNLAPSRYILCDYLGFYTGISWETDQQQDLINTVTLPRYADGKGVRAFMVQLFGNNANSVYTINYRNTLDQDVVSQVQRGNTLGTGGLQNAWLAANYEPFISLNHGDSGIKRVNSVTVSSLGAGIAVLVLVKVIAEFTYRDKTLIAPAEIDYMIDKSEYPIIQDGACLNTIFTSVGSPAGLFLKGYLEFIWG